MAPCSYKLLIGYETVNEWLGKNMYFIGEESKVEAFYHSLGYLGWDDDKIKQQLPMFWGMNESFILKGT